MMSNQNKLQLTRRTGQSELRLSSEVSSGYFGNNQDYQVTSERVPLPITHGVAVSMIIRRACSANKNIFSITFYFHNQSDEERVIWYKINVYRISSGASGEKREPVNTCNTTFVKVAAVPRCTRTSDWFYSFENVSERLIVVGDKISIVAVVEEAYVTQDTILKLNKNEVNHQHRLTFKDVYEQDQYKDFKFLIEGQSLMAHKAVLAAKSQVFNAMFSLDTKERQDGFVEIKDVRMAIFEAFVKFLYTKQVERIEELGEELLIVADKYDVQDLKEICEDYLSENLSKENVVGYLIKADTYNCQSLKYNALRVVKFLLKDCQNYDMLFKFPNLLREVLDLVDEDIKEQQPPMKRRKIDFESDYTSCSSEASFF